MFLRFAYQVILFVICFCFALNLYAGELNKNKNTQESYKNGVLLLTYDDRNFSGWIDALPLFKKYGAHATFFISGTINEEAISCMKELQKHGHSVGLHSLRHKKVPEYIKKFGIENFLKNEILPQLIPAQKAGLTITSFAYPNNARTNETDKALSKYFKHFRAGLGLGRKPGFQWSKKDQVFQPVSKLKDRKVFGGVGIGEYYYTDENELKIMLHRISERNEVLVLFSHNILPNAKKIHTPIKTLEMMLGLAKKLDIAVVGFNELP